jgi:putative DNA primase/helicase
MKLLELQEKYKNVPEELKVMKRWVCFKVEGMEDGKTTKRPYNALNGAMAKVNDEKTWTRFSLALSGCVKYNCDGIGFILGNGIFGIDLDNHEDVNGERPMTEEEFKEFSKEFIEKVDSYTELSQSGHGIHIIGSGQLPKGARRKGCVEMYDSGRFFAFTGNAIRNIPINEREKEVEELWEKYVNTPKNENSLANQYQYRRPLYSTELKLNDSEVIEAAMNSRSGGDFYRYYHDGDISGDGNDHSKADMAFCNLLAFWCNGDRDQMDRIFRNSALMREKWDRMTGAQTYGDLTIDKALSYVTKGYVKTVRQEPVNKLKIANKDKINGVFQTIDKETGEVIEEETIETNDENKITEFEPIMNIDEKRNPIFRIKKVYGKFPYSDTGNAMRFYAYFGDLFKYNVTDKIFMFWTGKTWIKDITEIHRTYANKFIEILKEEEMEIKEEILKLTQAGKPDEAKIMEKVLDACMKNTSRVANKAGKDAMINEFKTLYDIPIESEDFNRDDFLLNTESGVVDLRTGSIGPFNKELLLSKNTNIKVSYEEPKVWIKFLESIFRRDDPKETQEIVDSIQTCIGYSLTGSTREQVMFLLYGGGSNGKTTLMEQISNIMGDYGDTIASDVLMQQMTANNSATYSIAKLQTTRFVQTSETDDGGKLAEAKIKSLTGSEGISAAFKYGHEFTFRPKFKIWMCTNNKPIIRGTDLGIWRRIFNFPFINTFDGKQKDKSLPEKLKAESSQILGWAIKGFLKYQELNDLIRPKCLEDDKQEYKNQMDVVAQFLLKECIVRDTLKIDCKELYQAYKEWSKDNTEFTMKESRFSEELQKKGIKKEKNYNGKFIYEGVAVNNGQYSR